MPYRKNGLDKKFVAPYRDFIETLNPDFEFQGREEEMKQLIRTLHMPATNSIVLTGRPGVGRRSLIHGLVMNQDSDDMPNDIMIRPIFRMNTHQVFSSTSAEQVSKNVNDVLRKMKTLYERRGIRPILVIEDGTNFSNNVVSHRHNSVINALIDSDVSSNFLDLILNIDIKEKSALENEFPTFFSGFSQIEIEEPSDKEVLIYLRKAAEKYKVDAITIPDDMLQKIFDTTNQYVGIYDCAQPQRAIRFLDEVTTGFKLEMHSKPKGSHEKEKMLSEVLAKLKLLEAGGNKTFSESKKELEAMHKSLCAEIDDLYSKFRQKRSEIKELKSDIRKYEDLIYKNTQEIIQLEEKDAERFSLDARSMQMKLKDLAEQGSPDVKGKTAHEIQNMSEKEVLGFVNFDPKVNADPEIGRKKKDNRAYDASIGQLAEQIKEQASALNSSAELSSDYIEKMAQKITRIELNPNMVGNMANSETLLNSVVLGQTQMIKPIASALKRAAAGGNDTDKPLGSILVLGPSGVGKTFIAEMIAEKIFGDKRRFLSREEMQYHKESHTVSKLIGAPAGYAGYGDKGSLIEQIHKRPNGVLLLDEMEKGHKDIKQALLGALDTGILQGMDGESADLRNNLVIMTSNFGQDIFLENDIAFEEASTRIKEKIYHASDSFSPEFLNRCTIVVADFLSPEIIAKICVAKVKKIEGKYKPKHPEFSIKMDENSVKQFVAQHYKREQGARIIQDIMEEEIGDRVADIIIEAKSNTGEASGTLKVRFEQDKGFEYDYILESESAIEEGP